MEHYSDILNKELLSRIETYKNYSAKVFAKELGMQPSALSRILKRKQNVSLASAVAIVKSLDYDSEKARRFLKLVINEKIEELHNYVKARIEIEF